MTGITIQLSTMGLMEPFRRKCHNDTVLPGKKNHYDAYCDMVLQWVKNQTVIFSMKFNVLLHIKSLV